MLIEKQIKDSCYHDSRVRTLTYDAMTNVLILAFEDTGLVETEFVIYRFKGCSEVRIKHVTEYKKSVRPREMQRNQIPYFMQNVDFNEMKINGDILLQFEINMFPIYMFVICKEFDVEKEKCLPD